MHRGVNPEISLFQGRPTPSDRPQRHEGQCQRPDEGTEATGPRDRAESCAAEIMRAGFSKVLQGWTREEGSTAGDHQAQAQQAVRSRVLP